MNDLLEIMTTYIATNLSLTIGTEISYNEMPDEGIKNVCIQEPREGGHVYPQIDAEVHFIKITARDASNVLAKTLATDCYKLLHTSDGFVELSSNLTVAVELQGTPIWEKTDQFTRKYFYFTLKVITKIMN